MESANTLLTTYYYGGQPRVTEWPLDVDEAFCETSGEPIAVALGADECNSHAGAGESCPRGTRRPARCKHDPRRLDTATPDVPGGERRCLDCGLAGRDVTTQHIAPHPDLPASVPGITEDPS